MWQASVVHVESSHPREPQLMHTVTSKERRSWANEVAHPSYRIIRPRKRGLWYAEGLLQAEVEGDNAQDKAELGEHAGCHVACDTT